MLAIGTMVNEGVEQLNAMGSVSAHAILSEASLKLRIILVKSFY
jgi:hypothetical protein